jgi:hypothetical protein
MGRLRKNTAALCVMLGVTTGAALCAFGNLPETKGSESRGHVLRKGTVWIDFDYATLDEIGWRFFAGGGNQEAGAVDLVTLPIESSSTLRVKKVDDHRGWIVSGSARTAGALLLTGLGDRVVIRNPTIAVAASGVWTLRGILGEQDESYAVFELTSVTTKVSAADTHLRAVGELAITQAWADWLGVPQAAGIVVGLLTLDVEIGPRGGQPAVKPRSVAPEQEPSGNVADGNEECPPKRQVAGPDILVRDLQSVARFGRVGDITAYAVGTNACNIGDRRASWIAGNNQHPVIVMNMYRLKGGRYEQIGLSWVKHGFYAVSQSLCCPCNDRTNGTELGVGCSDPYSASLNGAQFNMSRPSEVNAYTGYFPYPWSAPAIESVISRRLQVHDADLDPDLNEGAQYFVQGHYLAADDAAAGNANNNASYRRVLVTERSGNVYTVTVTVTDRTQPGRAAIRAWKDNDSTVDETDIQVLDEGLFILSAKVSDAGSGFWHYEYALENLNSDRSAGSFSVPLPEGVQVVNIGFHDVDHHSGERYDPTDWTATVADGAITWSTETYDTNVNANAIRFGTLYNFRFDAGAPPGPTAAIIGLFKPGFPPDVAARTTGPAPEMVDCNENGIPDRCDTGCTGWDPPCGESRDCNGNCVPDECEPDCNENSVVDFCDIRDGTSSDCNENAIPDDCEPDCDGDGIIDDCDVLEDTDQDGVPDCFDACPYTTPLGACECPPTGRCCWPSGFCLPDYPSETCIAQGGTPECREPLCRNGCLIGDCDGDGHRDLKDICDLLRCFSGPAEDPAYVRPTDECLLFFDFDEDGDVDPYDYRAFVAVHDGP